MPLAGRWGRVEWGIVARGSLGDVVQELPDVVGDEPGEDG